MSADTDPASDASPAVPVVVMGVCGSGKSTIGALLADALASTFIDGDRLHPQSNVDKMASGMPLNDDDRWPWLQRVGETLGASSAHCIIACSALKRIYRQHIALAAREPVLFVHLAGSRQVIETRMQSRAGHFMPLALLESQLATLEQPDADEFAIVVDVDQPVEAVLEAALTAIRSVPRPDTGPANGNHTRSEGLS